MKLTLLGMVAILGFVVLMAIITRHLWNSLVAENMSGEEHDERYKTRTVPAA